MNDTPPEIAAMVQRRLLARSGAERFMMGVQMFESARAVILASFPSDLSREARRRLLFERVYGESLPSRSDHAGGHETLSAPVQANR